MTTIIKYAQSLLKGQFPIIEGLESTLTQLRSETLKKSTMVFKYFIVEETTGLQHLLWIQLLEKLLCTTVNIIA
jgi:hypothetical protein